MEIPLYIFLQRKCLLSAAGKSLALLFLQFLLLVQRKEFGFLAGVFQSIVGDLVKQIKEPGNRQNRSKGHKKRKNGSGTCGQFVVKDTVKTDTYGYWKKNKNSFSDNSVVHKCLLTWKCCPGIVWLRYIFQFSSDSSWKADDFRCHGSIYADPDIPAPGYS